MAAVALEAAGAANNNLLFDTVSERGIRSRDTLPREQPWRDGSLPTQGFTSGFLDKPVVEVARNLLGCRLISSLEGERTVGVIVETEAYGGPEDPASHAATVMGITKRNAVMFGPSGYVYVYRIYGIHWCMNVVTGLDSQAQAVLIRGLDPIDGEDVMRERRGGRNPIAGGPGRVTQAMGVTGALQGHRLTSPPLALESGWTLSNKAVRTSGRIGVTKAADWPYRFYVHGARGVSRHPVNC